MSDRTPARDRSDERPPITPGSALRWLRTLAGKSMGELADFLDCSTAEVSAIEREAIDPLGDDPPTKKVHTLHGSRPARVTWVYEQDGGKASRGKHTRVNAFLNIEPLLGPGVHIGFPDDVNSDQNFPWRDFADLSDMKPSFARQYVPLFEAMLAELRELSEMEDEEVEQ